MRGPMDISRDLLAAGVAHEIVHLRRRIDAAVELPDVLDQPGTSCVNVRLYDSDVGPVAALTPADRIPAGTAIARAIGATTLAPTEAAAVSAYTDYHPSLVAPVGLPAGLLVVADDRLDGEVVFTPTGDGSTALKIRREDLLPYVGARVSTLVEPTQVTDLRDVDTAWRAATRP